MAYVTGPDGKKYTIHESELDTALSRGFRVRQPDAEEVARAEASNAPVQAGVEAAVRTFVPVVGQELLTGFEQGATGQTEAEVLKGQQLRKEENPLASGLGTGVGFAAGPGKLLKPVIAPMRAAGLIGTGAAGLVEGGLFGLEEAVNESMIDQSPLTAEKVAASVASGALAGGAVDLGLGTVAKGASALLKATGGKSAKQALLDMSRDAYKKQLVSKSQLKKYNTAEFIDDIVDFGEREGILTRGTTYESGLAAAQKAVQDRQPMYDLILDGLEGLKPARNEVAQIMADAEAAMKTYDKSLLAPTAQSQLKRLEDLLTREVPSPSGVGPPQRIANPDITWRDVHKLQSDLFAEVPPTGAASGTKRVLDSLQESLQQNIEKRLNDNLVALSKSGQLAPEVEALGIGKEGAIKKLSKEYAQAKRLEEMFADQLMSAEGRAFGMKELAVSGAAGIATGGLPGAAIAVGGALGGKTLRERGGFLLGGSLRKLADSGTIDALAKSFQKNVLQRLAVAPELLGPFRNVIEQAASQGAMDLLQTHVELLNSRQGPAYARQMGIEPSTNDSLNAAGAKMSAYDALNQAARSVDDELNSAVDAAFGSSPGRKGSIGTTISYKDYRASMETLKKTLANPELAFEKMPPELSHAAPGTTGMAAATVLRGQQFLLAKAPKNPFEGMPVSVAPPWQPSAADLDKFSQYKEAVEQPAKVLKNLAQGYVSPEQIEAVKAVYPAMYADLQQKIGERLAVYNKPLTFQQKLAFTAILGPAALGMTPQQIQVIQQSQALAVNTNSGQGSPRRPDGRQDVNEAQIQTEAQKLEART